MSRSIVIQRIEQFFIIIATLAVIYVNYLAGTGQINDTTPGAISDQYLNALTPAGYAFSIWSVIYCGLICFSIYQALPSQIKNLRFQKIRTLYLANCAANIAWLYSWHYGQILISVVLMLIILLTLLGINRILYLGRETETTAAFWLARIPFGIYFGWITAAAILNATIALIFVGVQASPLVTMGLAGGLIAVATALAVLVRRGLNNIAYALTIAWALVAIAVKQQSATAIFATALIGAIISVISVFFAKKDFSLLT